MKKRSRKEFFRLNYTLFLIFFTVLILFVPSILYYFEWEHYTQDKKEMAYSIQEEIDGKVVSVKSLLNYTFFDEDFQRSLKASIEEGSHVDAEKIHARLTVSSILRDSVNAIWFFPQDETGEILLDNIIMSSDSMSAFMPFIVPKLQEVASNSQYLKGEYFSFPFENGVGERVSMIIGHRVLSAVPETYLEPIGFGIAIINLSGLTDSFSSNQNLGEVKIGLYDENGEVICGNTQRFEANIEKGFYKITIESKYFGLKTIICFDNYIVLREFLPYLFSIIGVMVFLVVLFFCYVRLQEKKKFQAYESFISTFRKISEGNLQTRVDKYNIEDFDLVGTQFNLMMDSILRLNSALSNEQLKTFHNEAEKDRYVLKYLSTQINKHFIFNTFSIIRSFVNLGRNDEAAECIDLLCNYLRFTFKGKDCVTVSDEISALKNYLDIQKIRIKNIEVELFIDERLNYLEIPQFILQPIVENAYKHAFNVGEGKIIIEGRLTEEDFIEFSVSDNGIGIDREKLDALNHVLDQNEETSNVGEIGLINVQRRIKILTGREAYIVVESEQGKGTKVILRLGNTKVGTVC